MIRLEVEATLPPDYGAIEMGYRLLCTPDETLQKLEVYVVKRGHVEACTDALQDAGLKPNYILPSAVIWAAGINSLSEPGDLLFCSSDSDQCEIVFTTQDDSVSVRSLPSTSSEEIWSGVADSIRAMASERELSPSPVVIDWVGAPPPVVQANGHVQLCDRTDYMCPETAQADNVTSDDTLLRVAANVLIHQADLSELEISSLLPTAWSVARKRRQMVLQLAMGSFGFLGAMLCVYVALKVSTARYMNEVSRLDSQIAQIVTDGESTGHRLAQIEAVAQARATRSDFANIVMGLHDASPSTGLSYSQVSLDYECRVQLRGQSDSLAIPFELPQRLEQLTAFEHVQLLDAGQTKKGIGSITEFRIEAQYQRGDP